MRNSKSTKKNALLKNKNTPLKRKSKDTVVSRDKFTIYI